MIIARSIISTSLLVLSICVPSFAQTPKEQPIERNIYFRALLASMEENEKAYRDVMPSQDYHHVIVGHDLRVIENHDISDFPKDIKSFRVEYLNPQGLIERYKRENKRFPVCVVRPMQNEGDRIIVAIVQYLVSYRKKRLNYELSDGAKVTFRYDCDKREFVIENVQLWGI